MATQVLSLGSKLGAKIALAGYANSPNTAADNAAIARLATASGLTQVKTAVGLTPPPPSSTNPTAGRTIFGVPVVDVAVGGVVIGALGYLASRFI